MIDLVKMAEKFGGLLINLCQIVFGGVVIKGLFGDTSNSRSIAWTIGIMILLGLIGLVFSSVVNRKRSNYEY